MAIQTLISSQYGQKSISRQDLTRMRLKIRAMGDELKAGINKIPCTPRRTPSNFAFHHRIFQSDESQLNSWARLHMSMLTHRSWMLACHVRNTGSFVSHLSLYIPVCTQFLIYWLYFPTARFTPFPFRNTFITKLLTPQCSSLV